MAEERKYHRHTLTPAALVLHRTHSFVIHFSRCCDFALYNKETGNRVLRGVKTKVVIIFVALHNKPNFDLSRCYEFLPSIYKGFEIDVLRGVNLKIVIFLVALHNKPSFDLSSCYEICPPNIEAVRKRF